MVDALDSKSSISNDVWVRDPPSAQPIKPLRNCWGFFWTLNLNGEPNCIIIMHSDGYILMDTVVPKVEGARLIHPQVVYIIYNLGY